MLVNNEILYRQATSQATNFIITSLITSLSLITEILKPDLKCYVNLSNLHNILGEKFESLRRERFWQACSWSN